MEWFRSWHGAPTDPKWLVVARKAETSVAVVVALWWTLLDRASQHEDRGSVDGFDTEAASVFLGVDEDEVQRVLAALEDRGMIEDGKIARWNERQRGDYSTPRVRAFRERKKRNETQVKRSETKTKRSETPGNTDKIDKIREEREQPGTRAKALEGKPPKNENDNGTETDTRKGVDRKEACAVLAPLIRKHLWLGSTPPTSKWSMDRDLDIALGFIERGEATLEEMAGAVEVMQPLFLTLSMGERKPMPTDMRFFNVKGERDRLMDCIHYWRKRQRDTAARHSTGPLKSAAEVLRNLNLSGYDS